jgi:hypothetical protein
LPRRTAPTKRSHRLRASVSTAVDKIWSKDGIRFGQLAPAANQAESAAFYDSIAKLSPHTEAQHFIQKRALEISGAIRQTRALMVEQINSAIPLPFLAVLVFWISILFVGFGLFARANATVVVALLIGALSVSSAIFLILELNHGHLEKYSLEAGRSAIEVAVVSVSGLMGAGLSSRLFEAATRAIGKTI